VTVTRVLLSGFEPFGGAASNPSGEVVRRLISVPQPELADAGIEIRGVILPVSFRASGPALRHAIEAHSPDLVIALGLADGRSGITPERIAINLDDARIPDNDGDQPIDEAIEVSGPAARFSTLPVKAIVAALTDAGLPASVSLSAGSYVCNHVAYILGGVVERDPALRAGFIHVPATPDLVPAGSSVPTMTLDELERGIRIAIITSVRTGADARLPGGSIH
jgi:pyroglutamyl-peptidase